MIQTIIIMVTVMVGSFIGGIITGRGEKYVLKDALLEWAKEELSKASISSSSIGRRNAFIDVIDKLNSM